MPYLHACISVAIGLALGLTNLYLGLRLGFVYGIAIMAAFCWAVIDRLTRARQALPDLACHIALASAMSFGCGTVVATSLAAVVMASEEPVSVVAMTFWVAGICGLGTVLALPLRSRMLARFPFPSGKVAGETVVRLSRGEEGLRPFALTATATALWVLIRDLLTWVPAAIRLPFAVIPNAPYLVALGVLLGVRVCLSMWLGGTLFFLVLPRFGVAEQTVLWFATGMMVAATLVGFLGMLGGGASDDPVDREALPVSWRPALVVFALIVSGAHAAGFGLPLSHLIVLPPLIWLFAVTACRVTGETDVVPTGALGKLGLLIFSFKPGGGQALMGAAGVLTGASASSADLMTDLRTGERLGCPPNRQFHWQLAGSVIGPLVFVPVFFAVIEDVPLGGALFPAPAARIWMTVAEVLGSGSGGLVFTIGLVTGAVLGAAAMRVKPIPSPTAMALAAFLDWGTTLLLAVGALAAVRWRRMNDTAACSAVIATETALGMILLI